MVLKCSFWDIFLRLAHVLGDQEEGKLPILLQAEKLISINEDLLMGAPRVGAVPHCRIGSHVSI